MKLKMYTDGGSRGNPGPSAIGVLICDNNNKELLRYKDYIGDGTNNIAEYCALIAGLEIAADNKAIELECFLDSELVVKQMTGIYKVKKPHIKKLVSSVVAKAECFNKITYTHLPRSNPYMVIADSLVNKALDENLKC